MRLPWRRRKRTQREREEINRASQRVNDLTRRTQKIVRDNHLVQDIKKALGAQ